ncbi:MAG: LamG domain-containing protein [Sphingobacteriales bacterium]|nr:MAG: LamG domain-containing protein [Sphingobacteriales bacterium]
MKISCLNVAIILSILLFSCGKTSSESPVVDPLPTPLPPPVPPFETDPMLKQGLLLYYPFNAKSDDESGNDYHLQVKGPTLTSNRFGEQNKAYNFNGVSDYMIIPPVQKSDSLRDLTISLWVKTENNTSAVILSFLLPDDMKCSSYIGLDNSGGQFNSHHQMISSYTKNSCTAPIIKDSIGDPLNKWTHILLVQHFYTQGSLTYYRYYPYVNGKKLSTAASAISVIPQKTSFTKGGIVGGNNVSTDYQYNFRLFKGAIDDIRVYNRLLTEEEIGKLYAMKE